MKSETQTKFIEGFELLLNAAADYIEYEWSGDPWEEDRRQMGEMDLDSMSSEDIGRLRELLELVKAERGNK